MANKILLQLVFLIAFFNPALATTYYMCGTGTTCGSGWADGNDSNNGTSKSTPALTLYGAFGKMSGGDTLIIGNGTYTGDNNCIWGLSGRYPPIGSSDAYTTVKSETDGEVYFDGQAARNPFDTSFGSATSVYWKFEGLIWHNSASNSVSVANTRYAKFLRCGAYDPASGNTVCFNIGTGSSYILLEGCYAWGLGRYKFLSYQANYIILRNCVVRSDLVDTSTSHNPTAGISIYSSNHVAVQNSIVIDSDQDTSKYLTNQFGGCFAVYTTSAVSDDVTFTNSICLKSTIGGLFVAANNAATNIVFSNNIFYDINPQTAPYDYDGSHYYRLPALYTRAISGSFTNLTIGDISDTDSTNQAFLADAGGTNNLYSSIFLSNVLDSSSVNLIQYFTNYDYNDYYNNTAAISAHANDITTNPLTNSLFYLPRIETGSDFDGQGQSGSDIGANLIYQQGASETLWGEAGYATQQTTLMWPYPNESLIKSKMSAYSNGGVSGARGFCTGNSMDGNTQTLTKYIWEYLGNQIPSDVYGETSRTAAGITFSGCTFH